MIKSSLALNIKTLRKDRGLSQEKLARKADILYSTLNKIETNVIKNPSVFSVAKIAKALDTEIEKLLK